MIGKCEFCDKRKEVKSVEFDEETFEVCIECKQGMEKSIARRKALNEENGTRKLSQ